MKPPRITHSGTAYEDRYQSIQKIDADFGRFTKTYYVHDHGYRVGIVVPVDGKILLAQQYRLLVNGPSLEIPGGRVDTGESPKQSAIRECFEETGVRCGNARSLVRYMPGMDIFRNPTEVFVASRLRVPTRFHADEREVHETVWIPLPKVIDMIFAGRITCGLTVLGILAYAQEASRSRARIVKRAP